RPIVRPVSAGSATGSGRVVVSEAKPSTSLVGREGPVQGEMARSHYNRGGASMRTIWNGSISFGLVNIPIGLALATQRSDIAFRTLHRECGTPIKQKRWCPLHEREVEADELV